MPRNARDTETGNEITDSHVLEFLKCYSADFYVSPFAVRDAIRRQSCFNLTHCPTSFKIDFYKLPSAVAKRITGSHGNGYLFFGLTKLRRDQ